MFTSDERFVHKLAMLFVIKLFRNVFLVQSTNLPDDVAYAKTCLSRSAVILGESTILLLTMLATSLSAVIYDINGLSIRLSGMISNDRVTHMTEYLLLIVTCYVMYSGIRLSLFLFSSILHYICIRNFMRIVPLDHSMEKISDSQYRYIVADSVFVENMRNGSWWLHSTVKYYRTIARYLNVTIGIERN